MVKLLFLKKRKFLSSLTMFLILLILLSQQASVTLVKSITLDITKIGTFDTGISAFDVVVEGDIAFVTDDYTGFYILNISDPTNPTQLNHTEVYQSYALWIEGEYAFIGTFASGLLIFDISNPTNPVKVGEYDDGGSATDIKVVGDIAYVADYTDGLEIINVSNPTTPFEIGNYTEGEFINNVHIQDDIAFVTVYYSNQDSQLVVLDISNHSQISTVLHSKMVNGSATLHVKNNLVFLSSWNDGLTILDFTNITNPVELSTYKNGGVTPGAFYSEKDNLVFLARYSLGFDVLDISDPTNPILVGNYYDGTGSTTTILVIDDFIYVTDKSDGLEILQYEDTDTTEEALSFPWVYLIVTIAIFYLYRKIVKKEKN